MRANCLFGDDDKHSAIVRAIPGEPFMLNQRQSSLHPHRGTRLVAPLKSYQAETLKAPIPDANPRGYRSEIAIHTYQHRVVCFGDGGNEVVRGVGGALFAKADNLITTRFQKPRNGLGHAVIREETHQTMLITHAALGVL
jgi:hypothetical protein